MADIKHNPITYQLARIKRTHFTSGRESRNGVYNYTGKNGYSDVNSVATSGKEMPKESYDEIPLVTAAVTFVNYLMLLFWGYISDVLRNLGLKKDGIGKEMGNDVNKSK